MCVSELYVHMCVQGYLQRLEEGIGPLEASMWILVSLIHQQLFNRSVFGCMDKKSSVFKVLCLSNGGRSNAVFKCYRLKCFSIRIFSCGFVSLFSVDTIFQAFLLPHLACVCEALTWLQCRPVQMCIQESVVPPAHPVLFIMPWG